MCDNKASVAPFIYFCTAAEAMAGILSSSLILLVALPSRS